MKPHNYIETSSDTESSAVAEIVTRLDGPELIGSTDLYEFASGYDKDSLKAATLKVLIDYFSTDEPYWQGVRFRNACRLSGHVGFEQEEVPVLFKALVMPTGRLTVYMLSKAIQEAKVKDRGKFVQSLCASLPEFIRERGNEAYTFQLIRVMKLYGEIVDIDQLDDPIVESVGAELIKRSLKDVNELDGPGIENYLSDLTEMVSNWSTIKIPAYHASQKLTELLDPQNPTVSTSIVSDLSEKVADQADWYIGMPGATDLINAAIRYYRGAASFVQVFERTPALRRNHRFSVLYERALSTLGDSSENPIEDRDSYDEAEFGYAGENSHPSQYFRSVPLRALLPDPKGEHTFVNQDFFASNGLVSVRTAMPSKEESPEEIVDYISERAGEVIPSECLSVHFIPFDSAKFQGNDSFREILRMSMYAVTYYREYLQAADVPDHVFMYGVTNPRMANILAQCGFTLLGWSEKDLKDLIKHDVGIGVSAVATVGSFMSATDSERFHKLSARLLGSK